MSISRILFYSKYIFIPIIVGIISIFAAEGVFRIIGDRPTEDKKGIYTRFSEDSYKLAPNMDVSSRLASGRFSVHTDSLGLRCDDSRAFGRKKGDSIYMLFLGDSQGFGNGVDFEDTIPGRVAVLANQSNIRVANASVGGHSLKSQLKIAQALHDQYDIRVSQYMILLTPVMMRSCDSSDSAVVGKDGRLYNKKKTGFEMAMIWLKTNSVTYVRIRDAIRNIGIGANPTGAVPFVFQIFDKRSDENALIQKFKSCLTDLRSFASSQGSTLAVVYVPMTIELDFSPIRLEAKKRGIILDQDLPLRACTKATSEMNIPLYNLRPVLENANSRGRRLRLIGDYHYNADLSRECGNFLWQEIEKSILKNEKTS